MAKDESKNLTDVYQQLRITNRLLAARMKATMAQQELVKLLSSTGASYQEIADVLDTTPATVATTLQRIKKKATRKPADGAPQPTGTGEG